MITVYTFTCLWSNEEENFQTCMYVACTTRNIESAHRAEIVCGIPNKNRNFTRFQTIETVLNTMLTKT